MGQEKRYFWLKLPEGFFRQKEIKRLRKIAGGDTYTIIYLKMLLRSLSNNGVLFFDGVENDFVSELALDIDEDEENVGVTVQFLMKQGILEEIKEDEYLLKTCADMVGSEAANAERMRRLRKKVQASQCDGIEAQCDNDVTNCDARVITCDTEKDIEKDIEKEIEKEKSKKKSKTPTVYYPSDDSLNQAFADYVSMRNQIRKPMTDRAINIAMNKLQELSKGNNDVSIQIIEQSILHGWLSFYRLKDVKQSNKKNDFDEWGELLDDERRSNQTAYDD